MTSSSNMAFEYFPSLPTNSSLTILDSPPSLLFSDNSSEDFEDPLDRIMDKDDVSSVMAKVLGHLTRIAEHLREREENDAANEIAKQTITIVNVFNDATASWDIQKCLMSPSPLRRINDTTVMAKAASGQPMTFAGGSWAKVAATATAENNRLVKFRPSDALKRNVPEEVSAPIENCDTDMRVVWIQPWDLNEPLVTVTERLSQYGALLSMAYSETDRAVCIIFQHTYMAQALLEDDTDHVKRFGHGIFGPQSLVLPGQAYPTNDDLRRMGPPLNERRRLTFARQALFTNGLTEDQFKKDIYTIVGEANVELVWLFNTGNATVVFSATVIARMVRDEFRNRSKCSGAYRGVQVTFSHDPCERPMNLITQMSGNMSGSRSTVHRPGLPSMPPGALGGSARRVSTAAPQPIVDSDGWQTVRRR